MKTLKKENPPEETPIIIRKTTEYLRYDYAPEELAAKAQDLAAKITERETVNNTMAGVVSEFKGRIKKLDGEVSCLTGEVSAKGEHRSVKCEWYMNHPRKGKKMLLRTDTGEIVREDDMLDSDFQMVLDDLKARAGTTERTIAEKVVEQVNAGAIGPDVTAKIVP